MVEPGVGGGTGRCFFGGCLVLAVGAFKNRQEDGLEELVVFYSYIVTVQALVLVGWT
jgi:hypothetical protein